MDHGITTWPTRVISKKAKLSDQDLNRIADWLNDTHDSGSIHSSYWERVESVKLYMVNKYKKGKRVCLAPTNYFRNWLCLDNHPEELSF